MRKVKTIVVLLLAVCIVFACAALPGLVSAYRDGRTMGQTYYETVPNIQLQIRGEEDTLAMAKLAMMCRMDGSLEISESVASMTREEAEARALAILQKYIDVGLVDAFDPVVHNSWCMLATVTADPSLNGVYWTVTVVSADESDYAQLDLAIDDESGEALAVSFASEKTQSAHEREEKLSVFTDLFFSSLKITDYSNFVTTDLDGAYIGENSCAVRYHYVDDVYGEVNADLYVNKYGFYTEFPNLGGGRG